MDGRQRIMTAMRGETPDRVPCALSFYHVSLEDLTPPGAHDPTMVDVAFIRFPISPEENQLRQQISRYRTDTRLGTASQVATYQRWQYAPQHRHRRNPLSNATTLEELKNFPFPVLDANYHVAGLSQQVDNLHAAGLAAGGNLPHLGGELFEAAWRLRGLETFLLDLVQRPEMAHFLLDRLTDLARRNAITLVRAGVDILSLDDDVGMPGTMMIGPNTWRTFLKARYKSIIDSARAENPDLQVLFHSDGYFTPIIPDLIEIGVQAINPVQPDHMDATEIRDTHGTRLALWGTVGRHTTFSFGTPQEIRAEVKERIQTLGRSGLILCPAYDIDEPDIPWENIAAFLQAVREFG
jgi:uroporphyrinogen decarboxylase